VPAQEFLGSSLYGDFPPAVSNFLSVCVSAIRWRFRNLLNLKGIPYFPACLALRLHPLQAEVIDTGGRWNDYEKALVGTKRGGDVGDNAPAVDRS
jgi:hypothetical protein